MALSKKKSRLIVVAGEKYRFTISMSYPHQDYIFDLNITIQHESANGAYLKVNGLATRDYWLDFPNCHPINDLNYPVITPWHIEKFIAQALSQGWQPLKPGPPFAIKSNNAMLRVT